METTARRASLVFLVGSLRRESLNLKLAQAIASGLSEADPITVTWGGNLNWPLYNFDDENSGLTPSGVYETHSRVAACDGLVVVTPEYNSSMSAVLKNAVDWLTRIEQGAKHQVFHGKHVLVATASESMRGGIGAASATAALFRYLGARVLPIHLCVPQADKVFSGDRQSPHYIATSNLINSTLALLKLRLTEDLK
ncbi:MAG: NAD(P)H-dependent oxidoreductase [Acidobacteriota bacterium]|nr:NAD(P)H-dependent oxidoreductase [Acidobacteriota bacterium]